MDKQTKVGVIGLGYVGLPLAIALSKHYNTIGFDASSQRIYTLKQNQDITNECSTIELKESHLVVTDDSGDIKNCNFYIIAVPTPIDSAKQPDLRLLTNATKTVATLLKYGDIVVYESTVYPGVTEEVCLPFLEDVSGLQVGRDFGIGYSPERINPGDKVHSLASIVKIVSGDSHSSREKIASVYSKVVEAGLYKASSIKVAEAAKVIENTQRDLNIALINELALIFNKLNIDTLEVLEAANTKWNFMPFKPGLVGGHCIGVDPYYLTHKAEQVGYHPQVILAGRRINDYMGKYIAEQTILQLIHSDCSIKNSRIAVLGATFKENCNDIRNSKTFDIIHSLREYHLDILVHDPLASVTAVKREHGITLKQWEEIEDISVFIITVAHDCFKQYTLKDFSEKFSSAVQIIIDVKGMIDLEAAKKANIKLWRL